MGVLPQTNLTVQEFFAWWDRGRDEGRFELVDGEVRAMGLDRVGHNRAKTRAFRVVADAVSAAGVPCEAFADGIGVTRNNRNFRLPDLLVNCGRVEPEATIAPNPLVVFEIISPSSEERDVHVKLAEYFEIDSIQHYLILYPGRSLVVHHSRNQETGRIEAAFASGGSIILDPPGISVSVAQLLGKDDN